MRNSKRKIGIDLIRAGCILFITGFRHLFYYTKAMPFARNEFSFVLTQVALGLLVLISGYLVGKREVHDNAAKMLKFYWRKIVRIYPLYFLSVLLFKLLDIGAPLNIKAALTLTTVFHQPDTLTLWYVSMISVFYAITPILLNSYWKKWSLIGFSVVFMVSCLIYAEMTQNLDFRIILFFPNYVIGIILAKIPLQPKRSYYRMGLIAVIVSLLVILAITESTKEDSIYYIPLIISAPSLIFYTIVNNVHNTQRTKGILAMSYASYCLYLFHRPIYSLLIYLYYPQDEFLQCLYLVGFCLPVAIAASYIIQNIYDGIVMKIEKTINSQNT